MSCQDTRRSWRLLEPEPEVLGYLYGTVQCLPLSAFSAGQLLSTSIYTKPSVRHWRVEIPDDADMGQIPTHNDKAVALSLCWFILCFTMFLSELRVSQ